MSEVSYIDSSGIAALVEGLQSAKSKGKQFGLVSVSKAVMAVLQLARLDRVFTIFPDLDAAREESCTAMASSINCSMRSAPVQCWCRCSMHSICRRF